MLSDCGQKVQVLLIINQRSRLEIHNNSDRDLKALVIFLTSHWYSLS